MPAKDSRDKRSSSKIDRSHGIDEQRYNQSLDRINGCAQFEAKISKEDPKGYLVKRRERRESRCICEKVHSIYIYIHMYMYIYIHFYMHARYCTFALYVLGT